MRQMIEGASEKMNLRQKGPHVNSSLSRPGVPGTLLARLINTPDLARTVRGLPAQAFSKLVQHVGLEDAGEIIALATTDQLEAAFDEDLFVNTKPGERETFDSARFVLWLEILLEAGDDITAKRVTELSEDFVVQALSGIVLVLDYDALLARVRDGGEEADYIDKSIENSLYGELYGYLLISRKHEGWDAVLALILAVDRDHRRFLERILNRCANLASGYLDNLEELSAVISAEDSLAEDVEAERENRRGKQGYVEPQAARNFLYLARQPLTSDIASDERDPVSRDYFRNLERPSAEESCADTDSQNLVGLLSSMDVGSFSLPALPPGVSDENGRSDGTTPIVEAMRLLHDREPALFNERMEELEYLANVLMSGAGTADRRFRPVDAAEAVFATVGLGAELEAHDRGTANHRDTVRATPTELCHVLRSCPVDLLFRRASRTLVERNTEAASIGFLRSHEELEKLLEQLGDTL
jgi:hypothetical protein